MGVAVEQREAKLPGDLPYLLFWEIFSLNFLIIDERLHIAKLSIFHAYIEWAPITFELYFLGFWRLKWVLFGIFLLHSLSVDLFIYKTVIKFDDVGMINFFHHFDLVDHFFVLLTADRFFYFDFFQGN